MNDKALKSGTTTLGIVYNGGVILAADKKTTLGGQIVSNIKSTKIEILNERIAVAWSGLVSDTQLIRKIAKAQIKLEELRRGKNLSTVEIKALITSLVYNNIRKMSPIAGVVGFLLAVSGEDGVHLYDISMDGSCTEFDNYAADGSGMMFAMGVLDAGYKPNMTLEEAKKLAISAVNSAIQRDTASGGGINIVAVTKKGAEEIYQKKTDNSL